MKRNLISCALALSSLLIAGSANAIDGNVHFRGEVIDSTCEVTAGTKDQNVDLGKVNKTAFTGVSSTAAAREFTISLVKCPDTYSKAAINFEGADAGDGDLAIGNPVTTSVPGDYTGSDTAAPATNVAIRIYNKADNSQVKLYKESAFMDIKNGKADLEFIARYIATADIVTPGTANADAQFTVIYQK
nr:chaperone-usher fimbrial major subunit [uncultured Enterobacter sp.]